MAYENDIEIPQKPLFSEVELAARPVFTDFYGYLRDNVPGSPYGPSALEDTFFDRMRHERPIMTYLVGRTATHGALNEVLQEARLREGKAITDDQLPHLIISSLAIVRARGEWDNSEESRTIRKELLSKGIFDLGDHPLIVEATELGDMLKHDGHEAYAQDAIIAIAKWYERIEHKVAGLPLHKRGDPAA